MPHTLFPEFLAGFIPPIFALEYRRPISREGRAMNQPSNRAKSIFLDAVELPDDSERTRLLPRSVLTMPFCGRKLIAC